MGKESFVRDENGTVTHIDVTSDDETTTWRHPYNDTVVGSIFWGNKGPVEEEFTHHKDGSTTSKKR